MGTLWQDIRYGVRMLRKTPGFTAVAVLTLALGIGANTAIFTLIEALLFKSLPVRDPQQLTLVTSLHPSYGANVRLPYALYQKWSNCQSFSGLAAWMNSWPRVTIEGRDAGEAERVLTVWASGNLFDVAGVPALLGRTLTVEDDHEGSPETVAVIGYGFWQRCFGLDPNVIGKTIRLEDVAVTIIGVTPPGFYGFLAGSRADVWLPLQTYELVNGEEFARTLRGDGISWMRVMGRRKPGVTLEQARAELDVTYKQFLSERAARFGPSVSEEDRQQFLQQRIVLDRGATGFLDVGKAIQCPLLVLMGTVGLVLVVACANLAGLLLARGAARRRELGVRSALGASRLTLIRQLATESLLLALLGGGLGLLLAQWGTPLLAHYTIFGFGKLGGPQFDFTPDPRILAFTFVASAFAGVLFGLVPAWRGSRVNVVTTLKDQMGGSDPESGRFWNRLFMVSQIALSCCLLIGAGLFVRTVQKLRTLDTGINRENLLAFQLNPPGKEYGFRGVRRADLYREILRRVESLPGVRSACRTSVSSGNVIGDNGGGPGRVVQQDRDLDVEQGLEVGGTAVTLRYFETMGIPLLRGRDFGLQDEPVAPAGQMGPSSRAAIIDETTARKLFGDENPVGKLLRADRPSPVLEVIGVAKDVVHHKLRDGTRASIYTLTTVQEDNRRVAAASFYIRTAGDPLALARGIRQIVREVDPKVPVIRLQTMTDLLNDQLFQEQSLSSLVGFFSLLALVLACLGLYGTLSYAVVRRTREIGVRMALGAQRHDVVSAVTRQGMTLALIGCVLGVILAVALTRIVSSLLYGVTPTDPLTFAATVLLLGVVALVSCWLPARRAARVDPMVALRYE